MNYSVFTIMVIITAISSFGAVNIKDTLPADPMPDSAGQYVPFPRQTFNELKPAEPPHKYNPVIAGGLSAILPGAGQIYCSSAERAPSRRYAQWIRGVLYPAAQGIGAAVMVNRIQFYQYSNGQQKDSALAWGRLRARADTTRDSTAHAAALSKYYLAGMNYDLAVFAGKSAKYAMYQAIGWNVGIYLFNVMNAVGCSGYFYNDKPKNPVVAGWLSAVPCLALGQLYNGAIGKAGMIWMTETMLLDMAFNNNRLVSDCITKREQLADSTNWRFAYSSSSGAGGTYASQWESNYNDIFKRRNLYLWYGVFFYFYTVFDAVVDAHLHDFNRKIRMEPSWDAGTESAGVCFKGEF